MRKKAFYSLLLVYLVFMGTFTVWFFRKFWETKGVLEESWYSGSPQEVVIRYSGLATVPLVISVFTVMFTRMFTSAGNTLESTDTEFLVVQKNILQNNLEQTFLFLVNYFSVATELSNETLALVGLLFVSSRLLYYLSYPLGVLVGFQPLRGPGFILSFGLTVSLLKLNIYKLLEKVNLTTC